MVDVDKMETATVDQSEEKTTTPRFFRVNSLIRLVDKQEFEVEFQVLNLAEGGIETVIISRTDISPKFIKNLIVRNGGVCIDADKACKVVEDEINQLLVKLYCAEGSCKSILRYKHQTLGWRKRDDEVEFCADKIYRTDRVVESEYAGAYKIQPIGTMDNIISMAKRCILGHTPLEAAVAAGVAATLLSYSNLVWGTSMDNPILHLSGTSTTGKSTVAKLIASFGGQPEGEGSMCLSFLSTGNAIIKRIGNNQGYPCSIDELSTSMSKTEWSEFVYTLANGYEKDRCASGGAELQKAVSFDTVIITNRIYISTFLRFISSLIIFLFIETMNIGNGIFSYCFIKEFAHNFSKLYILKS